MAEQADRTGREGQQKGARQGKRAGGTPTGKLPASNEAQGRRAAGGWGTRGAERGTSRRADRRTAEKAGGADKGRADSRKAGNSRGKGAR